MQMKYIVGTVSLEGTVSIKEILSLCQNASLGIELSLSSLSTCFSTVIIVSNIFIGFGDELW